MKLPNRILSRRLFLASSLLAGLMAPFLKPDRVEAAPLASFAPPVKVTHLWVPELHAANVTGWTKLPQTLAGSFPGIFTVQDPASLVEITLYSNLFVGNLGSSNTGVIFALVLDDTILPMGYTGVSTVRYGQRGTFVPATFAGYWQNLPAGEHAVSIYVNMYSAFTAQEVFVNVGSMPGSNLTVKEYLPFGTTYLPSIMQ
jgi:hypothetical protein